MYAIVESGGLQFRVEKEHKIRVPKLEAEVGSAVSLPKVLIVSDGKSSLIGTPYLEGAQVKATLLGHGKHEKVIIYKYKRRKNYRRKRGHRQDYSEIVITEIVSPELSAREVVRDKETKKPPAKKKAVTKKAPRAAAKEKKPAKPKAKPVRKKVTKRTTAKKGKPAKPAARGKKKPSRGVIGRLRRKSKKE